MKYSTLTNRYYIQCPPAVTTRHKISPKSLKSRSQNCSFFSNPGVADEGVDAGSKAEKHEKGALKKFCRGQKLIERREWNGRPRGVARVLSGGQSLREGGGEPWSWGTPHSLSPQTLLTASPVEFIHPLLHVDVNEVNFHPVSICANLDQTLT